MEGGRASGVPRPRVRVIPQGAAQARAVMASRRAIAVRCHHDRRSHLEEGEGGHVVRVQGGRLAGLLLMTLLVARPLAQTSSPSTASATQPAAEAVFTAEAIAHMSDSWLRPARGTLDRFARLQPGRRLCRQAFRSDGVETGGRRAGFSRCRSPNHASCRTSRRHSRSPGRPPRTRPMC